MALQQKTFYRSLVNDNSNDLSPEIGEDLLVEEPRTNPFIAVFKFG